jgi:hypothetical protein
LDAAAAWDVVIGPQLRAGRLLALCRRHGYGARLRLLWCLFLSLPTAACVALRGAFLLCVLLLLLAGFYSPVMWLLRVLAPCMAHGAATPGQPPVQPGGWLRSGAGWPAMHGFTMSD